MNYKNFGYTGIEGTCLWCGAKLHFEMIHAPNHDALVAAARAAGADYDVAYKAGLVKAEKAGPYRDDFFCTMSCGYLFGRRMAAIDRRLQ